MAEKNAVRVSFFSKKQSECPVCGTQFYREDLLTGRGRLIAGELTIELRRIYEPSQKYGVVRPLIYPITVCPGCFYAAFPADFDAISAEGVSGVENDADERIRSVQSIFPELDFRESRGLVEGAASYYLAIRCYEYFQKELSPTIKQGMSALRAAWLFSDLHRNAPEENYDYLSQIFYRKARFLYNQAVEYEQSGEESIAQAGSLGPDVDKNYGYDGVLYLASYLELHYGPKKNEEQREKSLRRAKTIAARIFGMGKASKDKPTALLDMARDLYARIRNELQEDDQENEDAE